MFFPQRSLFRFLSVALASLAWMLAALAAAPPSAALRAGETVVNGLGLSTYALAGPWRFHPGDDAEWAQPTLDDGGWELLSAEHPWGVDGHPAYSGYAWYRLRIRFEPEPGAPRQFALLMPNVDDVYEVYWNGVELGRCGKMPPYPVWYEPTSSPGIFPLGDRPEGVLAVRVWKSPPMSDDSGRSGGFESPPIVGYPEALENYRSASNYEWLRSQQFAFAEYLLYGWIGLAGLIGWLRDRTRWVLFWMMGFALVPILRLLLFGLHIGWPVALANGIAEPLSSLRDLSLWMMLLWLLHLHDSPALVRVARAFAAVSFVSTALDGALGAFDASASWFWMVQIADGMLTVMYFVTSALPLALVSIAVTRRRLDRARWLLAIAAFLWGMVQVVRLIAPQGSRFTHWTLARRMAAPLFSLGGNDISLTTLTGLLLLGAIVYAVVHVSGEVQRRQNAIEQELRSARELQRVLIPETLPSIPGYALSSAYRPAQEVGGDFFQILPLQDGSALVLIGDVSGKGLKAAMAVSLIVGLIRGLTDNFEGPAKLLDKLNARLHGRLDGGFTTCLALHLEASGNCALAAAGHPPPFLGGQEISLPGALPMGMFPAVSYEQTRLRLRQGESLTLFTDGLLEARRPGGELFGFDRLERLFATGPSAAQAMEAAVAFGQDDDITVVVLNRVLSGEESSSLISSGIMPVHRA
jgi:hypothetical protein